MKLSSRILLVIISINIFLCQRISAVTAPVDDRKAAQQNINLFFQQYVQAFENLDNSLAVNMYRSIDGLYLFHKAQEAEIQFQKEFDLGFKDIDYKVDIKSINIDGKAAEVLSLLDMSFEYSKARGIKSGIYNVSYQFKLSKREGLWFIEDVKSDYEKYRLYEDAVNEKMLKAVEKGYRNGMSKSQAIEAVYGDYIESIYRSRARRAQYYDENRNMAIAQDSGNSGAESSKWSDSSIIENGAYVPSKGAAYAQRFAESPISDRFFYTAESDCTNFVSQCIWGAYGGYIEQDDAKTKENIKDKAGMTNDWLANTGGGTAVWESVEKFYEYMKDNNKSEGPKAKVFNDNSLSYNMKPEDIKVGDVLQFRKDINSKYTHSVYVTSNIKELGFRGIFVCQHSTDWKNRCLEDLILSPGWGGFDKCYMRRLSFQSDYNTNEDIDKENTYTSEYPAQITENDVEEGKEVINRFYAAINEKDYDTYSELLGKYRKVKNGDDREGFLKSSVKYKVKEIKYPGRYHDMKEPPRSYEEAFQKRPKSYMYLYVVVDKIPLEGKTAEEELDFILIKEEEGGGWVIHDVGV